MSKSDGRLDELVNRPPKGMTEEEIIDEIVSLYPRMLPSREFEDYEAIHRYARKVLPIALVLESQFPSTDHFITHFGMTDGTTVWNTVSYFGERYVLSMQVSVIVDYDANTFVVTDGKPKIQFLEVSNCDRSGQAEFNPRNQRELSADDIRKVADCNWDWSCLNITINTSPVRCFKIYEAMSRSPRYPILLRQ
ncbi:MAG: hypothetical protein R3C17_21910 [Planctomycetaceae bacterium]